MISKNQTFEKIRKSGNLPKLPQVMLKLIKACNSDKTDTEELTRIISTDPSLTSKLMEMLGSGYINLPREINSIETAVVYLGMETIKNIAISSSAMHVFKSSKTIPDFDIDKFWFHSYRCGLISKKIAEETDFTDPEEAFLAGLLHDMGRLVLLETFPGRYSSILAAVKEIASSLKEQEFLVKERELFNTDSPEISAWLFKKWKLNPLISDALLYINEPAEQIKDALPIVKIIFIANRMAQFDTQENDSDILSLTKISKSRLEEISKKTRQETYETAKNLGIKINGTEPHTHEESLTSEIKDISLFHGTIQNLLSAKDLESILNIIENGLKIVFNVPRVFYFLFDRKKNILTGCCNRDDRHHKIVKSIALPMSNRSSIITRSLRDGKILSSLKNKNPIAQAISDTQISRLMGTKGICSLPMNSNKEPLGVILIGINPKDEELLFKNKHLVELFSKQCSLSIQNIKYQKDQAEIIHNEKMEAFSTVTRKIVHEINNPLAIVTNYIKMLSMKLPDKHPAQNELDVINEEMQRIAIFTARLSAFSEPEIDEFELIDINQLLTAMLEVIKKSILLPKGIETKIQTDSKLPMVKTDQNSLKQIFINLLKNSAEAMENGGLINITTKFISESEKIMIDEKKRIPGTIEIVIADNGPGIDEKIKDKLFEPYISSKKHRNAGLGLSIVQRLITKLNGTITCKSKKEKGTSFIITLPVTSPRKI